MARKNNKILIALIIAVLLIGQIKIVPRAYTADYFPNFDSAHEGYDKYLFIINPNNSTSEYPNVYYYSIYVPSGMRVGVAYNGYSYQFDMQGDSYSNFYIYRQRVIYHKDGRIVPQGGVKASYEEVVGNQGYHTNDYSDIYMFSSWDTLQGYLETGNPEDSILGPSNNYNSENIYLNDFRVIYHDSNYLDNCYVEVKYNLPQYILDNIDNAVLNVSWEYDLEGASPSNLVELDYSGESAVGTFEVPLYLNPNGFNYYIKDVFNSNNNWFKDWVVKESMLGDELIVNFDDGVLWKINKSTLYMNFAPVIDREMGLYYDAQIDLLNPSNTSYYSSTPDDKGNYTTNNDYTQGDGYYTTIVGTDGQGNNTYNYYYYDNSKHTTIELDPNFDTDTDIDTDIDFGDDGNIMGGDGVLTIVWGNALEIEGNISGSGGSGGSGGSSSDVTVNNGTSDKYDITILDDDYTDDALREDLSDGFGLFDNRDTELKADGYLSVAAAFFNNIDPELGGILTFGISSVVVIGILRAAFRR